MTGRGCHVSADGRTIRPASSFGVSVLAVALLLAACGREGEAPAPVASRLLELKSRWEWSWPGAAAGFTMRVSLSLGYPIQPVRPEQCPVLPVEARIFVNDRAATIVDAGGPRLGGLSGTVFHGCKEHALAEIGPFTREEARAVRVRLEEGTTVATAELGDILGDVELTMTAPERVKVGEEIVLGVALTSLTFLSRADFAWQEGASTRQRGSFVALSQFTSARLRVVGGPGRVTLTLTGQNSRIVDEVSRCEGFAKCQVWQTPIVGPLALEVVP